MIQVTLKGGVVKEYEAGITAADVAKDLGMGLYKAACGCKVNGKVCDLRTPLGDTFEVWADAFITGKKSTDTDWDAYVAEMKNLSIDEYLQMYNDNK